MIEIKDIRSLHPLSPDDTPVSHIINVPTTVQAIIEKLLFIYFNTLHVNKIQYNF